MKILMIVLLTSCSLFKTTKLDKDPNKVIKKVCLSSSGEGQIETGNLRYPFNFETGMDGELWIASVSFPLQDEAVLEVDVKKNRYRPEFEDQLLMSTKGVNPKLLRAILKSWSQTIRSIYLNKTTGKKIDKFIVTNNSLQKKVKYRSGLTFKNTFKTLVDDTYFKYQFVEIADKKSQFSLKVTLYVRECLNLI